MNKWTIVKTAAIAAAAASLATAASAQTRGVTATEVTFGMHTDLSGVAATYGVSSSNAVKMRFDEINDGGRHQRPQDQGHHRGPGLPGAQGGAGLQQADQPRQGLRLRGAARHADEQRLLQGPVRGGRAQPVPAVGRALDVRALRAAEVLRCGVLRRPGALGHRLLRQDEGQEGRLRDVPGHRLRQGGAGRRRAADQEARHQDRRDARRTSRPTRTSPRRSASCARPAAT